MRRQFILSNYQVSNISIETAKNWAFSGSVVNENSSLTCFQIARLRPKDLADVYEALAYYHRNPEEMRDVEAHRQQVAEEAELVGKTRLRFLLDKTSNMRCITASHPVRSPSPHHRSQLLSTTSSVQQL